MIDQKAKKKANIAVRQDIRNKGTHFFAFSIAKLGGNIYENYCRGSRAS